MSGRVVAIVGRPNVGKSALFNRIARREISLVFDRPGTTRDRLVADIRRSGHVFTLVDTGGIGVEDAEGFGSAIEAEVGIALESATDVLLIVDGREGITPLDQAIASRLRRSRPRIWVVVNKLDDERADGLASNFFSFGFGEPFAVSAAHGRGIDSMLKKVMADWPEPEPVEAGPRVPLLRLAILGRPNVGKSSLINAITGQARVIVADKPGTTRDAVDVICRVKDTQLCLIDTAGMRPRTKVRDELERAMTARSAHAINRADICILVIDGTVGVQMQDKKIAGLIAEAGRPCLIAVNKWDLAQEQGDGGIIKQREFAEQVRADLFFMAHVPVVFVSAKTGTRVGALLAVAAKVGTNAKTIVSTGTLNRVLSRALDQYLPPIIRGRRFKIYYATQQTGESTPEPATGPAGKDAKRRRGRERDQRQRGGRAGLNFILFVNEPALLTPAYQRYLELQVREEFQLEGAPIHFVLRPRVKTAVMNLRRGPSQKKREEHSTQRKPKPPRHLQARGGKSSRRK